MAGKTYAELVDSLKKRLRRLEVKLSHLPEDSKDSEVSITEDSNEPEATPISIEHTDADNTITPLIETEKTPTHQIHREDVIETSQPASPESSFHIVADKKTLLKQEIKGYLRQGQQPTAAIKKHFVDQLKKCSKASFYRYIQELKQEHSITVVKIGRTEYCTILEK